MTQLIGLKDKYSFIKDVRGRGLMIGIELELEGQGIVNACLDKGVLINCTMDKVLRFLPPLIVSKGEAGRAIAVLDGVLGKL